MDSKIDGVIANIVPNARMESTESGLVIVKRDLYAERMAVVRQWAIQNLAYLQPSGSC